MISTSKRDVSHSPIGGAQTNARRRKHRLASVALAAVLAETLVVSGSVTAVEAATVHSSALPPASSTALREPYWTWGSNVSLNPYSPDWINPESAALFGLAAYFDHNRPGANPYYPEIAESWTVGAHSITFNLQPNAVWQDGSPLTATDVVDSMLVAGGDFNSVWEDVTGVSAPNAHTVVVTLQPWAIAQTALLRMFEFYIVPPSYYSMLPPHFQGDILTYWKLDDPLHLTAKTEAAASNSAAGKAMSTFSTNLVKYNPTTLDGNGAYKLVSANTSGYLFEKSPTFWDASKITAPWIQIFPMNLSETYGANVTGRIDFQQITQYSDPEVQQLNSSQYGHYVFIPSAVQEESLLPHLADYPLGILQVRQALEYIIQRAKVTELDMGGSLLQNPPTPYPDGINDFEADQYMTPAQFKTLNPYNYDPAKATALLESVGFKLKGGTWYTPKGTAFSLTIDEPSANSQFDTDGIAVANMLKAFGINAQCVIVNQATYTDQQYAGDYELSEQFQDWEIGTPMSDFAQTFAWPALPSYNYPVGYDGKGPFTGSVTIGFPVVSNVPGLGTVNIAQALNQEINTAAPSTWGPLTYDWARWFNQNLPFLPMYDNAFHEAYSTSRYTDFPPLSAKWLWTNLSDVGQPVVWMQDGYLKLK
ncbi:MAG TPA: ABC transporter substrate-binding protein [Acidimicrobiales bacterium]|nr:ABC transporter substrate-binding protein [Acidimicrobiales bacterium]